MAAAADDSAAITAAPSAAAPAQYARSSPGAINGLFPLWEQTGILHDFGSAEIGYQHAQIGLGRLQLGTQPILDLHEAFNGEAKVALWRGQRLSLALVLGAYRFGTNAESRTAGNLYRTGFANPYAPVWMFPLAFAKSLAIGQRLTLHWTSTLLITRSDAAENQNVSGGQTIMAELAASPHWAVRLHTGAEGWPVQSVAHVGLSVSYTGRYLFVAAGMARKFSFDGEASNQALFDGGLLFP